MPLEMIKKEIESVMAEYLDAFAKGEVDRIDRVVSYPLTHLGRESAVVYDHYPIDPRELKEKTGWSFSRYETDVIAASETKAHVIGKGTRHRADGSIIETIEALYVFYKKDGRFKIAAVSDITRPV